VTQKQFQPYSAGNKVYGMLRSAPNIGPVDKLGYRNRDRKKKSRKDAIARRLQKEV